MSWIPGESLDFANTKVYEYVHSENGLRVLLCPVPSSEVCAYMRVVQAGSKEEADFVPKGMAHFLEHMSFRINGGKIWDLAAKGDVINAMTNMDSTRYYVVHLPGQTDETIRIDASRFGKKEVPADKIPVECHAVLNELERGQQAGNAMFQTTSAVGILEHPYHSGTIGTKTEVIKSTAADMEHFRERFYVPNNATLIFAGSFEPERVLAKVHEHFGSLQPGADCRPVHTPEPPQMGKRTVELNIDAPCPMICMAFRQPPGNTKEAMALQCIERLTWQNNVGRASTLIEDNTLHDVSTYAPRQIDPYLWFFHGTQEQTSPELRVRTEQKMLAVLQSFATQKVSKDDLQTTKIMMRDDWHRSLESVTDMMNELGRCVTMGNWKDYADRGATLDQLTPEDIQRVASAIFQETQMTVTHVIPTKSSVRPAVPTKMYAVPGSVSPAASELPTPRTKNNSAWTLTTISPSTHVLNVPKASYVRATLSARFSPAEHDVATIMTSSMGKGTVGHGRSTTATLMALHTERSFSHDHEFVHMSMAMPVSIASLQEATNIMFNQEWLQPGFSSEIVELQKRHHIAEIHALKKDQGFQTKSQFIQALFTRTKYHIPLDTRADAISKLSVDDVSEFHAKWIQSSADTYVTMVTPTAEVARMLGNIFPVHDKRPNTTLEWTAKPRAKSDKHIRLAGFGSFQIMMGQTVSVLPFTKESIALECAATILGGGMTARLMHTVRELRGLGTYGLYAGIQHVSPKSPVIFCVQGTFSPTSLQDGLECTRQIVGEWARDGVTPVELATARSGHI